MKIIRKRTVDIITSKYHLFEHSSGQPVLLGCDDDGTLECPEDLEAYHDNPEYTYIGIETEEHRIVTPKLGECDCGENVVLSGFTNTCVCGTDYNMSGQKLAPREQWGWETGEHWTDLMDID